MLDGSNALSHETGARRALGVVLLRHRIAEQRKEPIAELLGNMTAHLGDRADHTLVQLKERGDPWRLNEEAPTGGPPST